VHSTRAMWSGSTRRGVALAECVTLPLVLMACAGSSRSSTYASEAWIDAAPVRDNAAVPDATAIDAIVMASAGRRGDVVYTSDFEDLVRLQVYFRSVRVLLNFSVAKEDSRSAGGTRDLLLIS
jgi:hypothetical protein